VGDDAPTAPMPVRPTGRVGVEAPRLDEFPSLEDRQALERALLSLVEGTGAAGAVLHAGRPNEIRLVAQVGGADALLEGLIGLALELNTPQVITHVTGPNEGKAWGAWPFRTTRTRGVLAASGIDPAGGWTMWEKTLEELRTTWDERDRAQAGPAFPIMPEEPRGWLDPETFRTRLQLAVDRNQRDGLSFAVHRLALDEGDTMGIADQFALKLPEQLRDTDCICRPGPRVVLMLSTTVGTAFDAVRRRLGLQWEELHRLAGATATPILKRSAELLGPADAEGFMETVNGWLGTP
jgi:hypothetical protein